MDNYPDNKSTKPETKIATVANADYQKRIITSLLPIKIGTL